METCLLLILLLYLITYTYLTNNIIYSKKVIITYYTFISTGKQYFNDLLK